VDRGPAPLDAKPESDLSISEPPSGPFFSGEARASRRIWQPERGAGQLVGAALTLGALIATLLGVQLASGADGLSRLVWVLFALAAFGGTVLAALLLLRLRSIRYSLDDGALGVSLLGTRLALPYTDIADVIFRPRDVIEAGGYERIWPGFYASLMMTSDGVWRSLATTPPHERVRIVTRSGSILAISPERPVLFVEALEAAMRASQRPPVSWLPADDLPPTPGGLPVRRASAAPAPATPRPASSAAAPRISALPTRAVYRILRARVVRGDPVASRLLALSLLVLIILVFISAWKVDSVNRPLAVKWNAEGEPTWFVRPDGFWLIDGVWIYPLTVAAVVAVNTALATLATAFQRTLEARLLMSAAFVVGCVMLVAMVRTTGLS
jgi:hypothetical protein